jgi:hypothetical protein
MRSLVMIGFVTGIEADTASEAHEHVDEVIVTNSEVSTAVRSARVEVIGIG